MSILMVLDGSIFRLIEDNISLFDLFERVYLFGSALDPDIVHNDIDILVIYSECSRGIENALSAASDELKKVSGLPVDMTALSDKEEKGVDFLKRIEPHYLRIK